LLIATSGAGLLAFNGSTFRQVLPEDLAARSITALLPLASGRVLLGAGKKGLLVYDGQRLALFHEAFAGLHITALAGDESEVWAGTTDRGVLRWHAGEIDRFGESEGLPDRHVLSLAVRGDSAYAGTSMGVADYRNGKFARALAPGVFAKTLLVRETTLVIGTMEEGVIETALAARSRPVRAGETIGPAEPVERLAVLDGRLFALSAGGLWLSENSGWTQVLKSDRAALGDRNIAAVAVDRAGRTWVGYFDRGLEIVEPGGDRSAHVEDEHVFCVNRIVHEDNGRFTAVATANGLVLFDSDARKQRVLTRQDGLIASHVTDVVLDKGGMVAATPAGLTFIDGSGMRSLYAFHGLVNNHAYALAASGDRLLVGTLGGLSILDRGAVTASFTTANSALKHNWISAVVAADGEWFAGTYGEGVWKLDAGGQWQSVARGFEVNPNAMVATDAAIYAGTLGRGLMVFDRRAGRHYVLTSGLPSLNVTALAARGGYLYIGTDNGLVRVPEGNVIR
jgi:ligand-binding sensor domain-containing protein